MRAIIPHVFFLVPIMVFAQSKLPFCSEHIVEFAPMLTSDNNTLYYQTNPNNGFVLYEVKRTGGAWGTPIAINIELSGDLVPMIGGPSISITGDTLYFCAQLEDGMGDMDIYMSIRQGSNWGKPQSLGSSINTTLFDGFPSVTPNGKTIYFTRSDANNPLVICQQIYVSHFENGDWTPPQRLPGNINASCPQGPRILRDGKTLLYSSEKSILRSGIQIYKSELQEDGRWTRPELLDMFGALSTPQYATLTNNQQQIIVTSDGDLYELEVPLAYHFSSSVRVVSTVIDAERKTPFSATAIVRATNSTDTTYTTFEVDSSGILSFSVQRGFSYSLEILKESFEAHSIAFSFQSSKDLTQLPKVIPLEPKMQEFIFDIADAESGAGLEVDIKITNLDIDAAINLDDMVGRDGKYAINLREGDKYNIEVSNLEGYAFAIKEVDVPTTAIESKLIAEMNSSTAGNLGLTRYVATTTMASKMDIPDGNNQPMQAAYFAVSIPLKPLSEGTTIDLDHIYFESESSSLDSTSFNELEKVVQLMSNNPNLKIEVAAHTDKNGSKHYNQRLSENRAQVVVKYLSQFNVDKSRLIAKGYGESSPISDDPAQNRRVELLILKN